MPVPIMYDGKFFTQKHIGYWEASAWYGALMFARSARRDALAKKLTARFEPLFGSQAGLLPKAGMWSDATFAVVPFELYLHTQDARYLSIGTGIADSQRTPLTAERLASLKPAERQVAEEAAKAGLSSQPRAWIVDEAYLIAMPQVQAFRATGNREYIDHAAREMLAYLDKLQQPNGLFHHAPTAPFFWGRGNGWAAAGMAELLRTLPEKHADRPRIMSGYRAMMPALLKHQHETGMWKQLIDHPEAWLETSCTGMFTFAFVTGVKQGWLDAKTYAPAARKGWLGLTRYLNANAELAEVCEGTWISSDPKYYLNRDRYVGDLHGQAAVLWSASALRA